MTDNDIETQNPGDIATAHAPDKAAARRSLPRTVLSRVSGHARLVRVLAFAAVAAVIAGAYVVGGPAATADAHLDSHTYSSDSQRLGVMVPAPAASGASVDGSYGQKATGIVPGGGSTADTPSVVNGPVAAPIDTTKQIVKTGQMTLEVNDLDAAASQAQSTITGLGGSVDQSDQSGSGDYATASITFRVPVDKWDSALAALRKIGNKVVSQSTSSSDVTSQVVDLAARIDNLTTTEHALQAIMARASAIPDVIAVEAQLSDTQGQIEQLTAQSNLLKNQAAMSTLSVVFQLPAKTVTTQATQDWTIGGQIDQAGAALVRIGQGLATIGVWILVVVLPIGFGVLVLFGIVAIARRILGRAGRRAAAGA